MEENKVIRDFGDEWERFDFLDLDKLLSLQEQFEKYIKPLPEGFLEQNKLIIADIGAGSGRWSYFLKHFAAKLYVIEPSSKAFNVACSRFNNEKRITLLNQSVESNQVPASSLDLAVSLGVLHHIRDTGAAIKQVSEKIKPGGYFLGYLYYSLENKSIFYRAIWKISNLARLMISNLPKPLKESISEIIALLVYWPLARFSRALTVLKIPSTGIPLHHYENLSFHVMRNDALDRFGTSLENRFSRAQITEMLVSAGFEESSIYFSDGEPFWTFCAKKSDET
jgi:SAM-dependent methyltransferase